MTGATTQEAARAFRDSIGLAPTQNRWVQSYRRLLQQGSRAALDREARDRRFDSSVERAASGGRPLTEAQIERMVDRYRQRLLAMRAETIARTEGVKLTSQAREAALQHTIRRAAIPPSAVTSKWNAVMDHRTRDTHRGMNGQTRLPGIAFTSPSGARLRYPGDPLAPPEETINCRCHLTREIDVELAVRGF